MKCDACGHVAAFNARGERIGRGQHCPVLACAGRMQDYAPDGVEVLDGAEEVIVAMARGMGTAAQRCACGTLFASAEPGAAQCPPCRGIA